MRRFYLLTLVFVLAMVSPAIAGAYTLDIAGNATVLNRQIGDPVPTSLKLVSTDVTFQGAPDVNDDIIDWASSDWTLNTTLTSVNTLVYSSNGKTSGYLFIGAGSYFEGISHAAYNYRVNYYDANFVFVGTQLCPASSTTTLNIPVGARYLRATVRQDSDVVQIVCTDAVRSNLTIANLTFDTRDTVQSYFISADVTDTQLVVQSSAGTAVFAVPGLSSREVVVPPADPPMPTPVSIVSVETTLPVSAEIPDLDFELYQTALVVVVCVAGLAFVYMLRKKRR